MNTTVIISTYNGAKKLPSILSSLEKQSRKDFQLLVVVDGSTDNSMDLLKEWVPRFNDMIIIYQENKGRAAVRNTGVRNAADGLLIFFDDDLVVDENCISDHINYQEKTGFQNIFVGEIIDEPIATADNASFIAYKKYIAGEWYKLMFRPEAKIAEHIYNGHYYLAGANFSITKKIFDALGGLDESLNRSEDYEFAIRAKLAKIHTVLGDRYASVIHRDNNNTFRYWVEKARVGEINNAIVYAKDREKFGVYAPPEKTLVNFGKRVIFRSLANRFAYRFMLSDSVVKKIIPNAFLYRLYDLIVAANSKYYPDNVTL